MQECLKAAYYASEHTQFLINQFIMPIPGKSPLSPETIIKNLKNYTSHIETIAANDLCAQELNTSVVSGIFMLCYAAFKNLMPIEAQNLLIAIKESVLPEYLDLNVKTWELAQKIALTR